MPDGVIQKLFPEKGFGFIGPKGTKGVFFHRSELASGVRFKQLTEGQEVSYELAPSRKDPKLQNAVRVKPKDANARHSGSTDGTTGPTGVKEAAAKVFPPYRFMSVFPDLAVTDTPVWHDGSSGGDLLSGEIRCHMTALTPLLVGNQRFEQNGENHLAPVLWGGRVVVPGSSLKGMLRQSLAMLLNAPMERVRDQQFSYRPNFAEWKSLIDSGTGKQVADRYVCLPAIVEEKNDEKVKVRLLDSLQSVYFVHADALVDEERVAGAVVNRDFLVENGRGKNRIVTSRATAHSKRIKGRVYRYKGGIDGSGFLARAFWDGKKEKKLTQVYNWVLVPDGCTKMPPLDIDPEVYSAYRKSQENLATEHLERHPRAKRFDFAVGKMGKPACTKEASMVIARAIKASGELEKDQLVYVEVRESNQRIVSLGHHFYYRWAYTSSIRYEGGNLRCELRPRLGERSEAGKPPSELTAARLLFGYVHDKEYANLSGRGGMERLAGRIAINHALAASPIWLGDPDKTLIRLKALGSPKPSAVEFYIDQSDGEPLNTYGDTPDDDGGRLAGRKVYPHQPDTDLTRIKQPDDEPPEGELNTLAHAICDKDTKFGFSLRFARLRPWELGALLAALEPWRLEQALNIDTVAKPQPDTRFAALAAPKTSPSNHSPGTYGHRLGYGRPLGMGSVRLDVQDVALRQEKESTCRDDPESQRTCLDALVRKLGKAPGTLDAVRAWLDFHRFEGPFRGYPEAVRKTGEKPDIPSYHSKIRMSYATARRSTTFSFQPQLSRDVVCTPKAGGTT